jgi:hypothetical protein
MPKIIEILRLKYYSKLSHQKIAQAVGLSRGVISKYVSIASALGLHSWPLPDGVDEDALERRLFPSTGEPQSRYVEPDWFVVHQELKRKGVTFSDGGQNMRNAWTSVPIAIPNSPSVTERGN